MFWAMAALVFSISLVIVTVWSFARRGAREIDPALLRPPPPQGFANFVEAEWDFVEVEIWEEALSFGDQLAAEASAGDEGEMRPDGPP